MEEDSYLQKRGNYFQRVNWWEKEEEDWREEEYKGSCSVHLLLKRSEANIIKRKVLKF